MSFFVCVVDDTVMEKSEQKAFYHYLKRKKRPFYSAIHSIGTRYKQMSYQKTSALSTLSIELVYRILDNMDPVTIMVSCYNISGRLNTIIDTYYPYQVKFTFIIFVCRRACVIDRKIRSPYSLLG